MGHGAADGRGRQARQGKARRGKARRGKARQGEAISAAITRHSAESSRGGGSERAAYSLHSRFDTPAARSGVGEAARLKLRLRDLAMSVSHEDVYRSAGRR